MGVSKSQVARVLLICLLLIGAGCGRDSYVDVKEKTRIVTPPPPPTEGTPEREVAPMPQKAGEPLARIKPIQPKDIAKIGEPKLDVRIPKDPISFNPMIGNASASYTTKSRWRRKDIDTRTFKGTDAKDCAYISEKNRASLFIIHFENKPTAAELTGAAMQLQFYQNDKETTFINDGATEIFDWGNLIEIGFSKFLIDLGGETAIAIPRQREYVSSGSRKGLYPVPLSPGTQCEFSAEMKDAGSEKGWITGKYNCNLISDEKKDWTAVAGEFSCPLRTSNLYPALETTFELAE